MKYFFTRLLEIIAYSFRFLVFVIPITVLEGLSLIIFSKKEIITSKLILKPAKSQMDKYSVIDKLNIDNIDLYKANAPLDDNDDYEEN